MRIIKIELKMFQDLLDFNKLAFTRIHKVHGESVDEKSPRHQFSTSSLRNLPIVLSKIPRISKKSFLLPT
jgi:hypothetical protein